MSELNKKLYEAISKPLLNLSVQNFEDDITDAASACEKIVLQEKIDLLNDILKIKSLTNQTYTIESLELLVKSFTEQLNNLNQQ